MKNLIAIIILPGVLFVASGILAAPEDALTADELYQRGVALYRQGQYDEAGNLFVQALSREQPERDPDAEYQKGLRLYEQGDYQAAQEAFQNALDQMNRAAVDPDAGVSSAPQAVAEPAGEQPVVPAGEYIVGSGDILSIKVWQNQDLNDDMVIVRPDGRVSFSLVGDIAAAGKTIRAFRQDLTVALQEYIRTPQVSVSIKQMGGKRVIILGQVRQPGVYMVSGSESILEALGMAGGFADHAVTTSVVLVRGGFEKPTPLRLDLNSVLKKGDLKDNLVLTANDIVYVPKRFIADLNYFMGQMLEPLSRGIYVSRELNRW